jgi:serine/threonine protein kinase
MQIEVLGERYQLQEPIGRGGMATIYRGHDMRMDRVVAIKVLREVYSTDPKFVTRFQREAKAASSLQHPNIVQVFDYGQSEGNYFIVMELIEGMDLRRYLRSRGVLAIDRAIIITHDIALGLGAAHRRQIVHRDVKPQNILVGRDGMIKLTDFGIASVYKDINAERLTTTGMTLGTVQYYAPEQAQGEIVNPAADVYALGIVMYEMLTGRTPFEGDTPVAVAMQHIQDTPLPPSQLNPHIPPALEEIILRCLEKTPEMRYRDGTLLARALEALGEQEGGGVILPGTPTGVPPSSANGHATKTQSTSSPNHGMPLSLNPLALSDNAVQMEQHPDTVVDQPFGSLPSDPTTQMDHQQASGNGETAAPTRPLSKEALSANSGVVHKSQESRIAGIITIFILTATLLLLGFSVYLAAELGFLSLPGGTKPTASPTTVPPNSVLVPNFFGLDYVHAEALAQQSEFKLVAVNGLTSGKVKAQSLKVGDRAPRGETIQVEFDGSQTGKSVPTGLVGKSLDQVKQILVDDGFQYTVISDQNDPQDLNKAPNTVTRVDPNEGQSLQPGQQVTLFVTNLGNVMSVPPSVVTPTPAVVATPVSTPTPTAAPISTPTLVPTSTPTPTPTPTPVLIPTLTPRSTV